MTETYKAEAIHSGIRLESRKVDIIMKVGWKSRALTCSHVQSHTVTCSAAVDVECGRYPNLSKNIIKIKCRSVFFSLFVGIFV